MATVHSTMVNHRYSSAGPPFRRAAPPAEAGDNRLLMSLLEIAEAAHMTTPTHSVIRGEVCLVTTTRRQLPRRATPRQRSISRTTSRTHGSVRRGGRLWW